MLRMCIRCHVAHVYLDWCMCHYFDYFFFGCVMGCVKKVNWDEYAYKINISVILSNFNMVCMGCLAKVFS